jgi:hypothetical protein
MVKPVIYKRNEKGAALTFTEVDTSLQNLRDSTVSIAVTGSDTVINDLNDTTTFTGVDGVLIQATGSSQTITFDASLIQDTTPQLGGDLDVNGYSIVSVSDGNITLAPNGTGKVIISGDLQVDGVTTTINSTTVDIDDINITLAKGSPNATASDGGGITVEGPTTPATITYTSADDAWNINKDLDVGDLDIKDISGLQFNISTEQDHSAGRVYWDPVDGTLAVGMEYDEVVAKVGMNLFYHVKNQTGTSIPKGTLVMAVGTVGASGQILCAPAVTDGTVDAHYVLGITNMAIADGGDGYAVHHGLIKGLDTQGPDSAADWQAGTVLWADPFTPGLLTDTEPTAPNLKLAVAYVINAAANGSMFVRMTTGLQLRDLHDVNTTGANDGDVLIYDASTGVWNPGLGGVTYTISAEQTSAGDAFIQLLGTDSSVDSVEIAAGPGIEVERIDASRIEIRQTFPTWDSLGTLTWDDLA